MVDKVDWFILTIEHYYFSNIDIFLWNTLLNHSNKKKTKTLGIVMKVHHPHTDNKIELSHRTDLRLAINNPHGRNFLKQPGPQQINYSLSISISSITCTGFHWISTGHQLSGSQSGIASCVILVTLLHYFTLTNFFWMLVEGKFCSVPWGEGNARCLLWFYLVGTLFPVRKVFPAASSGLKPKTTQIPCANHRQSNASFRSLAVHYEEIGFQLLEFDGPNCLQHELGWIQPPEGNGMAN